MALSYLHHPDRGLNWNDANLHHLGFGGPRAFRMMALAPIHTVLVSRLLSPLFQRHTLPPWVLTQANIHPDASKPTGQTAVTVIDKTTIASRKVSTITEKASSLAITIISETKTNSTVTGTITRYRIVTHTRSLHATTLETPVDATSVSLVSPSSARSTPFTTSHLNSVIQVSPVQDVITSSLSCPEDNGINYQFHGQFFWFNAT
jgi:hypothetical protein